MEPAYRTRVGFGTQRPRQQQPFLVLVLATAVALATGVVAISSHAEQPSRPPAALKPITSGRAPSGIAYRLLGKRVREPSGRTRVLLNLSLRSKSGLRGSFGLLEPRRIGNSTLRFAVAQMGSTRGVSGPFLYGLVRISATYLRATWPDGRQRIRRLSSLPSGWGTRKAFVVSPNKAKQAPSLLEALNASKHPVGAPFSTVGHIPPFDVP
jgi:hypothetical protein